MAAGQQNQLAINQHVTPTWGTEGDCNLANAGLYYDSFSMPPSRDSNPVEGIGMTVAGQRNATNINVAGTLVCPFNYDDALPRMLTLFANDTVTEAGPYVHTFTSKTVAINTFMTLSEKVPQTGGSDAYRVVPSASGTSLTIRGSLNDTVRMEFGLLGDAWDDTPTTNTSHSNVTLPATNAFCRMGAGDTDFFAISDQDAGTNVVNTGISGFTFTYEVPREGGDHDTSSANIGLPDEAGGHRCTLEIEIPNYASTGHMDDLLSDQPKQALFTFPTATVSGQSWLATLKIPHLRFVEAGSPTDGPGKLSQRLLFDVLADPDQLAHANADTAAGEAWELAITNGTSTDYDTRLS